MQHPKPSDLLHCTIHILEGKSDLVKSFLCSAVILGKTRQIRRLGAVQGSPGRGRLRRSATGLGTVAQTEGSCASSSAPDPAAIATKPPPITQAMPREVEPSTRPTRQTFMRRRAIAHERPVGCARAGKELHRRGARRRRAHDRPVRAVALGDVAQRDHLRLDRRIGRVTMIRVRALVPQAVDGNGRARAGAAGRVGQRDVERARVSYT